MRVENGGDSEKAKEGKVSEGHSVSNASMESKKRKRERKMRGRLRATRVWSLVLVLCGQRETT